MWPFSSSSSGSSSSAAGPSNTQGASEPSAAPAAAAAAAPTSFVPDAAASSSAASPSSRYSPSGAAEYVPPSASALLLDPAFSPAALHPLAGLGKEDVEYLDIVDAQPTTLEGGRTALPSRGWSDDLCYGTGTTYLSGLALGGLLGAREGFFRPLGVANPTFRLRLNAVLNQVTRRGSFFGNSAGVIALIYNLADASIDAARGKHDLAGSVGAGAISGALFKCTAGVRPMMISSAIMMGAAATWTQAKQALL